MTDEEFLDWLNGYLVWYHRQARTWVFVLAACRILSLVATIISIIGAAAMPKDLFESGGRWIIVAAGALTAISTEILTQLKIREMEELREEGHLQMDATYAYARQRLKEFANDSARRTALMDEVRKTVEDLERKQHKAFVSIERTSGGKKR
jgi:hypothetical protein